MTATARPGVRLSDLRNIGWSLWDPIRIVELRDDNCEDEYDGYLMRVATMALYDMPRDDAVAYLIEIARDHMEVSVDEQRTAATVDAIYKLAATAKAQVRIG